MQVAVLIFSWNMWYNKKKAVIVWKKLFLTKNQM